MVEGTLRDLNIEMLHPITNEWYEVLSIVTTDIGDTGLPTRVNIEYVVDNSKRVDSVHPVDRLFRISIKKTVSPSAFIGFNGKEIKPMSLVRFRADNIPKKYHKDYPFKDGETVLFLGEVTHQPGHCAVVKTSEGKVLYCYHTDNFEMLNEEEV